MAFFTETVEPEPQVAAVPVIAGAEPLLPTAEGSAIRGRGSSLSKRPWNVKAREYYYDPDKALDLAVEFIDLRSQLAGLYCARAKIRDIGNKWVTVEDENLQALADMWRDADTGEQFTLVVDSARELSLVGEGVHQEVIQVHEGELPRFRYRILGTHQIHERDRAILDGVEHVLVQLRTDAGPKPRNGAEVPGKWTWASADSTDRLWSRGSMSHDALSPLAKGMRYLDRMAELEKEHFERTQSNRSLARILLLATNSELKKGDPDPVADGYWAAAEITRRNSDDLMARYPVPFRVHDPGDAQILDLIQRVTKEDIEEYQHLREMFATAMPCPKQALLEGAGASQRNLNNWMLDSALHEQCIHPVLNDVFAGATTAFYRPMVRRMQANGLLRGYDAEDLKIGWDPLAPSLADASPETIYRGWQLGLIPEDEANELLGVRGWSEEDRPGVGPYEHWFIAARSISGMQRGPGPRDLLEGWGNDLLDLPDQEVVTELPELPEQASTRSILASWK